MSEVTIANEALALVNGPGGGITSFADQTREAQLCQTFYASSRDAVLEAANWWFATKTATLAAPTSGPTYNDMMFNGTTYALPADCIRPIEISPSREGPKDWQPVADSLLVTSYPSPVLKYIARIEDTSKFTPGFVKALVAYMAWELAYPLTESVRKELRAEERYLARIKEARFSSGSAGRQRRFTSTRATEIRHRRS